MEWPGYLEYAPFNRLEWFDINLCDSFFKEVSVSPHLYALVHSPCLLLLTISGCRCPHD